MLEFAIRNLPLVLATVIVPALLLLLFMRIRAITGQQSSGADILQLKAAIDIGIAILPEPWLPIVNQQFKASVPGIFIALGVTAAIAFTAVSRVDYWLLRHYAWQFQEQTGRLSQASGVAFPHLRWGLGWLAIFLVMVINMIAAATIIRGVTFQ